MTLETYHQVVKNWADGCFWMWIGISILFVGGWFVGRIALCCIEVTK